MDLQNNSLPEITIKGVILGVLLAVDPGGGQRLPGPVCRHDGVGHDSRRGHLDGRAAVLQTQQHPRKQHRADLRQRGRGHRRRLHLHVAGPDHPGALDDIRLQVGHDHRRLRRRARRAVHHPAAAELHRGQQAPVPRGHRHGQSPRERPDGAARVCARSSAPAWPADSSSWCPTWSACGPTSSRSRTPLAPV